MDIFRFLNPINKTKMEQGILINGLKSKMWIERYRDSGEFTLTAGADFNVKSQLPIGSFISHTDTPEIMVVENHEIKDAKNKESEIIITGRSFEAILENRIARFNRNYPFTSLSGLTDDFFLGTTTCANGAVYLGSYNTQTSYVIDDDDALLWIIFMVIGTPGGASAQRFIKLGTLYERFIEVLEIDNLGVKITRPGSWSAQSPSTVIGVHKGLDKTKEIVRSYDTGEVESIDYLWSNKKSKNAALVSGKWVEVMVKNTALKEYDRRFMRVDGKDIDQDFTTYPTGTDYTNVVNAMIQRGNEALSNQTNIGITKAEIAKAAIKYVYRKDYNVGDLITVTGDYNEVSIMRVSEYVEIEDETGESGYPTLTIE
jgi:Siphovirus ReqiPepy6 Gp37-like protein